MIQVKVNRHSTNIAALDETLRDRFSDIFYGLSTRPGGEIELHFGDEVSSAELDQARQIAIKHDPNILSASQQVQSRRDAAIAQSRSEHPDELALASFAGASLLEALARRVLWLEREIRDLRGI